MKNLSYLLLLTVFCYSCTKEGPGGKVTIKGKVMHHARLIPNATVYIKYGTQDFPGDNVTYYDASTTADKDANYQFKSLRKGEYYLFGIGIDTTILESVTGGVPVKAMQKDEEMNIDIPVTEKH